MKNGLLFIVILISILVFVGLFLPSKQSIIEERLHELDRRIEEYIYSSNDTINKLYTENMNLKLKCKCP